MPDQPPGDYASLICILPDCRQPLAVRWELYAPLVHGELEPGGASLTPIDALAGGWRVECEDGHVILLPEPVCCDPDDPECSAGDCHHDEELRTWERPDVDRLAGLLRSAGVLPAPVGEVRTVDGRREVWSGAVEPGGWVCAEPVPGNPDGICGMPVESEPCGDHGGDRIDPPDRP